MRTLVVGDVHGCLRELQELLAAAQVGPGDEVVLLGDFVDRGPSSPAVFEFVRRTPNVRCVLGNHERKHLAIARGHRKPARSQEITIAQFHESGVDYSAFLRYVEDLPTFLVRHNRLLVHGFYEPGVPLELQRTEVLVGSRSAESYLNWQSAVPWYETYDGDYPIVVGHKRYAPNHSPFEYLGRVCGIDTDCARGGRLTGLWLPDSTFVQVAAHTNYWGLVAQTKPRSSEQARGTNEIPEDRYWAQVFACSSESFARVLAALVASDPGFHDLTSARKNRLFGRAVASFPHKGLLFHFLKHGSSAAAFQSYFHTAEQVRALHHKLVQAGFLHEASN
jgi:hypothetical protein